MMRAPVHGAVRSAGVLATLALTACGPDIDSDTAELATIYPWNVLPKSSPTALRQTFDRYCVNGPTSPAALEARLRAAGYVRMKHTGAAQVYLVDDRRPAVVLSDRLCGARATSRTGQTEEINTYVARTFPKARSVSTETIDAEVEQAWAIEGGMIATTRSRWVGNRAAFGVLIFRPEADDG